MTDRRDARVKVYGVADAPVRGLADEAVAILTGDRLSAGNYRRAAADRRAAPPIIIVSGNSDEAGRRGNRASAFVSAARLTGFKKYPVNS